MSGLQPLHVDWTRQDDTAFDPWRVPASDRMAALVTAVTREALAAETRQRKRRPSDQKWFDAFVSALVCDLAFHHLSGRPAAIHISRSKAVLGRQSRYKPAIFTEQVPAVLDLLASPEVNVLRQLKGMATVTSHRTKIAPTAAFLSRIAGIGLDDIGRDDRSEVVWLRAPPQREDEQGDLLDYNDADAPRGFLDRVRTEVRAINAWIGSAEVDFDESILSDGAPPDITDRAMRRTFTYGSFESGGRLAGGFWMSMKNEWRLKGLAIDGEPVARADFGQMGPRIVYGLTGAILPECADLYRIPGLESFRPGTKIVFNAALCADHRLSRRPKGTLGKLPSGPFEGVLSAIEAAHKPIAGAFYRGIGHKVQRVESDILVKVLLDLKGRGIHALPVHDGVVIPRSRAMAAAEAMQRAFRDTLERDIPVSVDTWSHSEGKAIPV